nr:hypothetical protein [Tanacetum cinerariifolium]
MIRIKMKKTLLDQTRGLREEEMEKNLIHLVHQRKRPPSQLGMSKEEFKSHQKSTRLSAQADEPIHTAKDLEEHAPQKSAKPLTPDRDWNKTLPVAYGPIQPWISNLAQKEDTRNSFNELMYTPIDFLAFMMNRLKVDTLTLDLLACPTFELMKGSCKSLVELEYFLEEVCKATTDQLDWNIPEG